MSWIEHEQYAPRFEAHWQRFLRRFKITSPEAPAIFATLRGQYGAENRQYHSLKHIVIMLDLLEEVRSDMKGIRPWFSNPEKDAAIEIAVWFHDAMYDPKRDDNEERSAELAVIDAARLGFSAEVARLAKEHVRATDHKKMQEDRGAKIVCDLDLASLGFSWEQFRENTRNIQLEYRHVPNEKFKAGRAAFFRAMLDRAKRPRMYQNGYFRRRFEETAAANMRRALRKDLID